MPLLKMHVKCMYGSHIFLLILDNVSNAMSVYNQSFTMNNLTKDGETDEEPEAASGTDWNQIDRIITKVYAPLTLGFGTVGNALAFTVMMRPAMRSTPTCVYMAALAVTDTVVLYSGALRRLIGVISSYK